MTLTITEKLYYQDPNLLAARARIIAVEGDQIVLDRTPFYPEGGGQAGDIGRLGPLEVVDTQKRGGRLVVRPDLPTVNVETEVVHHVLGGTSGVLTPGDEVELQVDHSHRTGCARHHGATHLVMCKIWELLGRDSFVTKGCYVGPNEARLDLATTAKFTPELLDMILVGVNAWADTDAAVRMTAVAGVPEMFIWECSINEFTCMPCGGTHFSRLGPIGHVQLQRRSKGKGLERLYIRVT